MGHETLICEKDQGMAVVTLNRPERRNALSSKLKEEVSVVLSKLAGGTRSRWS